MAGGARRKWRAGEPATAWSLLAVTSRRLVGWVGAVVVAGSCVDAVVFVRAHRDVLPQLAVPLAVLSIAPLLVLRWRPFTAVGVVVAANAVFVVASRLPWSPVSVLGWLVALGACPLALSRMRSLAMLAVSEAAVLVGSFMPSAVNARPWDAPITEALAALLAWGAAETFRGRREAEHLQAGVASEVRDLQGREALATSRAAFARDLHDVVAHHVSLIAVRAATAPYQVPEMPSAARDAFLEIAAQARTALDELRTVLGVLRTPDDAVPHVPQPGLADLPDLVERSQASGMHIDLEIHGLPAAMSEPVELCCYRVVQEALTNAARHAAGAPIRVDISYGRHLDVKISNTIAGDVPQYAAASLGREGFGLVGMRERVNALGGDLFAGRDGTCFRVEARLPIAVVGQGRD